MAPNLLNRKYSNSTHPLVCVIPMKQMERMVSLHCTGGEKEACVKSTISMTYDEERYIKESTEIDAMFYPKDRHSSMHECIIGRDICPTQAESVEGPCSIGSSCRLRRLSRC